MIIDWTVGEYAHLQAYYGVGFVLNWPGVSSYVTYDEYLAAVVIFSEALKSPVVLIETQAQDAIFSEVLISPIVLTETQAQDVILTETVSGKGVL